MVDDRTSGETDLRRRAAWLLAMLALVAVLFVVVLALFLRGGGHNTPSGVATGALDTLANTPTGSTAPSSHHGGHALQRSSGSVGPGTTTPATTHCPSAQPCALVGDPGGAVAAINDYRASHGQPRVTGTVSQPAQQCALANGNGCTGGWAETQVAQPNGHAAIMKILPFAHLLDSQLKNFEVGWAYDPGAKQYYFALIRND